MTEIHDADEMLNHFTEGNCSCVWWAPGDHTRYRVTYVNAQAQEGSGNFEALIVQIGDLDRRQDTIVVMRPQNDYCRWTPKRWVEKGYPVGWWAGVRPLLAALGWTDISQSRSPYYESNDAILAVQESNIVW